MKATKQANIILGFLQNIDDADDATEFVRIALDALESAAEHSGEEFDRAKIILDLACIDSRIV